MRILRRLVFFQLLLGLALASPVWARTVSIQAAVPLPDSSDVEFKRALHSAVETCVRGAVAMGLSWIRLEHAAVVEKELVVEMVGSDEADNSPDAHKGEQGHDGAPGHDGRHHGHDGDPGTDSEGPRTLM
jgi:hypothetical protein